MSFDFSTLITDRSQTNIDTILALLKKPMSQWTEEERTAFNLAIAKADYNYTDLNRVTAAMDDLNERLTALGYETGYQRVEVPHQGGGGTALPEGYTPLEYIQSSGTQYINSGYAPNQNTRVVADVQLMEQTTATVAFFGVRDTVATDSPNKFIAWSMTTGQSIRSDYFGTSSNPTRNISVVGQRITIDKNKNICSFGETVLTNTVATGQCQNNMLLFAENDGGQAYYFGSIKLYSCKVYDNDNLIRDFITCINAEGVVGLYDLVNDQFYGNAGTGEFIAAPIPVEMPDGYTQLEYIESHAGSSTDGQFINSGLLPNSETQAYIDYQFTSVSNHTHVAVLGSRGNNGGTYPGRWTFAYNGSAWRFDYNNANYSSSAPDGWSTRHQVTINKNVLTFNDGRTITASQGVFSGEYPLYIFANNTGGTTGECSNLRIWYARIDNQSEIAEFIPCKNPDGEIGLYNLTNGQFYANQGNGAFSGGPEIELSAPELEPTPELDPYTWYETDAPTVSAMAAYLTNVEALRGVLEQGSTPEVPADMAGLTAEEANAIEEILLVIEGSLTAMQKVFLRSGMAWAISGEPGFYFAN